MGEATLGRAGAPPLRYTYWTKSAEVSFRLTCRQSGNRKHNRANRPRWSAVPAPGSLTAWGVGVGCMCFVQHSSQSGAERLSHFSFIFTQKTHVQWALTYIPRVRLNPNEQRGTDYRERKNEKRAKFDKKYDTSEEEKKVKACLLEKVTSVFYTCFSSVRAVFTTQLL